MNVNQKALFRLLFQNRMSKVTGMGFQNLFSEIMRYARPDFAPVKPQGNLGDWKNDGHEPKSGRYYQVYSPEKFDEAKAVEKLIEDFTGLLERWGNSTVYPNGVKEFYFVINDAYRITPGAYPTTYATMEALRQEHNLTECRTFLAKDLEDIFIELPEDIIITIVGNPPNPADINVLSFNLVNEVIRHIVEDTGPRSLEQSLIDPDFDDKIVFNKLQVTSRWLHDAYFRLGSLEEYFHANSNFTRQEVRDRLKAVYEVNKTGPFVDAHDGPTASDHHFYRILNEITPIPPTVNPRLNTELQNAALVVMAYFFESCDIFEEPPQC